jgi:hypothetical protein
MLVSDGIKRAHAQGFPIVVTATPSGRKLYLTLGFVEKDTPAFTAAKIIMPIMVCEPPNDS